MKQGLELRMCKIGHSSVAEPVGVEWRPRDATHNELQLQAAGAYYQAQFIDVKNARELLMYTQVHMVAQLPLWLGEVFRAAIAEKRSAVRPDEEATPALRMELAGSGMYTDACRSSGDLSVYLRSDVALQSLPATSCFQPREEAAASVGTRSTSGRQAAAYYPDGGSALAAGAAQRRHTAAATAAGVIPARFRLEAPADVSQQPRGASADGSPWEGSSGRDYGGPSGYSGRDEGSGGRDARGAAQAYERDRSVSRRGSSGGDSREGGRDRYRSGDRHDGSYRGRDGSWRDDSRGRDEGRRGGGRDDGWRGGGRGRDDSRRDDSRDGDRRGGGRDGGRRGDSYGSDARGGGRGGVGRDGGTRGTNRADGRRSEGDARPGANRGGGRGGDRAPAGSPHPARGRDGLKVMAVGLDEVEGSDNGGSGGESDVGYASGASHTSATRARRAAAGRTGRAGAAAGTDESS